MAATAVTTLTSNGLRDRNVKQAVNDILTDYEIHRSPEADKNQHSKIVILKNGVRREAQPEDFEGSQVHHPRVPYHVTNPAWWPSQIHRIPDFRPTNKHLDLTQRKQNTLFQVVGGLMLFGCGTIAVWASIWRNTAGRFTNIGLTVVGGEW